LALLVARAELSGMGGGCCARSPNDMPYKFQNQKMSTLAMDFKKKEFNGLPLSNMNESGNYIFSSDSIRNCQFD
jgi:hypothetical protein